MSDNDTQLSKWQKFRKTVVWEYAQVIVVALILVFGFIRPFVVEAFKIPSGSMEDTLLVGDRILVCKFIYGITIPGTQIKVLDFHKPARGDVFVFIPPHDRERNFIKRIVAVEGDTIETRGGILYVNGEAVDDNHYTKHVTPSRFKKGFPPFRPPGFLPDAEEFSDYAVPERQFRRKFPDGKPFTVPKGKVFAMGDNRDKSQDSRTWGPVDVSDIKGQAFMVYWSFAVYPAEDANPAKIWEVRKLISNMRFNRIGKLIHAYR